MSRALLRPNHTFTGPMDEFFSTRPTEEVFLYVGVSFVIILALRFCASRFETDAAFARCSQRLAKMAAKTPDGGNGWGSPVPDGPSVLERAGRNSFFSIFGQTPAPAEDERLQA